MVVFSFSSFFLFSFFRFIFFFLSELFNSSQNRTHTKNKRRPHILWHSYLFVDFQKMKRDQNHHYPACTFLFFSFIFLFSLLSIAILALLMCFLYSSIFFCMYVCVCVYLCKNVLWKSLCAIFFFAFC